jgi:hypothetical protein
MPFESMILLELGMRHRRGGRVALFVHAGFGLI